MFEGFEKQRVATRNAHLFVVSGGSGPPLLLLHGYPQTHTMWHAVAERLHGSFSLIVPDLRGYGDSTGPGPDVEHVNYSKRAMAEDMVDLMTKLGHQRFLVAGHDRGGRVAYRLALDHPDKVVRLAVLDIVPTYDVWDRMDGRAAMRGYHWQFLAQPAPLPERMIGRDPDFYARHLLDRWAGRREALEPAAVGEYLRHFRKASVIQASCEDYRAGATIDLEHDRADREAGRKIGCPTLVVWGRRYLTVKASSPLDVWRGWATDVRDVPLDCGHFLAEEEPEACASALRDFFWQLTTVKTVK
jgi:haloacetate dehalogenase